MPTSAQMLSGALAKLQGEANRCARLFVSHRYSVNLRVIHVTGANLPWRLLEIHQYRERVVRRRMHYFSDPVTLLRCLAELRAWKVRDMAFVSKRLPLTRISLQTKWPDEFVRAKDLWVSLCLDLEAMAQERDALRRRCCVTRAERVVELPVSARK